MKKLYLILLFFIVIFLNSSSHAFAIEDPLSKPNNFMGIHILEPSELDQAKDLVNSSGGDWGYVTVPIQTGDQDLEKWQSFMDKARDLHVIPLIRLSTQANPFNTNVWRKPNDSDIIDFANFLSSLDWPTKNKYIILFNEVNRSDEWGGEPPSPNEYAEIVSYAHDIFKQRDKDFYMILSGMDAAAPNSYPAYSNGFTYLEQLKALGVLSKIDAFSSHSYPNPDFSAPPSESKKVSVATYRFEYDLLNSGSEKKLPVFITETGWSDKNLPESVISKYYKMTFDNIWNKDKDKIVAITPFLLHSNGGFDNFSFYRNGQPKDFMVTLASIGKSKGSPVQEKQQRIINLAYEKNVQELDFKPVKKDKFVLSPLVSAYFKTIFGLSN